MINSKKRFLVCFVLVLVAIAIANTIPYYMSRSWYVTATMLGKGIGDSYGFPFAFLDVWGGIPTDPPRFLVVEASVDALLGFAVAGFVAFIVDKLLRGPDRFLRW